MKRYGFVLYGLFFSILCWNFSILNRTNSYKLPTSNHTKETQNLLKNLRAIGKTDKYIFGAHFSTFIHQNGKYNINNKDLKSDCFTAVGSHPGIIDFDFNRAPNFSKYQTHNKEIYKQGGIVSYTWHANNPVTGGNSYDTIGNAVQSILTNGIGWTNYRKKLDKIANLFNNLKVDGNKVPVIFRPLHEHTGNWFWWGKKHCSEKEFIALWHKTTDYLKKKGVNNMLLAYAPAKPSKFPLATVSRYPGDDYVDIIGFDAYAKTNQEMRKLLHKGLTEVVKLAKGKNKVIAITEVGVSGGLQNAASPNWFTQNLIQGLKEHPDFHKIAYISTWQNSKPNKYWIPLKDQPSYSDFKKFFENEHTYFMNNMPKLYE
ncbi:glycoside hydrolase family 26 protein [Wenyingzhuangia sp. IMCC45574]